jgi:hypothetical protein
MEVPPYAFACSETELAFAAFQRADGGLVLREFRREALEPGTFQQGLLGGPPREPRVFAERVEAFVSGLATSVREASLVVPDAWLRTVFAEIEELPTNGHAREEVLRWKLKRLVPFRVDELRVRATQVAALPARPEDAGAPAPRRLLLGFGIESLYGHLEGAFRDAGVQVGRIANRGLSALGAVRSGEGTLTGLALASPSGYSVVFARGAEPVLHRFKSFSDALPLEARASAVSRDMRLTRTFLESHFPDDPLGDVVLAAPEGEVGAWTEWLESGLAHRIQSPGAGAVVPVRGETEAPGGERPGWIDLLPLAGTVCQEVSA